MKIYYKLKLHGSSIQKKLAWNCFISGNTANVNCSQKIKTLSPLYHTFITKMMLHWILFVNVEL